MHDEEKGLYAPDIPLAESKLEIAMQRFFARRKRLVNAASARPVSRLKGETGPRQFASTDYAALKEMDPEYERGLVTRPYPPRLLGEE